MKPKLFIRADGGRDIGLGHLIRCLALGTMLKQHFEVIFVLHIAPLQLVNQIKQEGHAVWLISEEDEFFARLTAGDLVVLDGYGFNLDYQKEVKKKGSWLACIDDLANTAFIADLIINHAPGIRKDQYKVPDQTVFALGTGFALLRPAFLRAAKNNRHNDPSKLLICFGGSDSRNLTESALREAIKFENFKQILVVTGMSYTPNPSFEVLLSSDPRIEHLHDAGEETICRLFSEAGISIVPASGVMLEALACGSAVVSGKYVDNQELMHRNAVAEGLVHDAGTFSAGELHNALALAIKNGRPASNAIDGKSAERLLRLFSEAGLYVREIRLEDCETLFNWANDRSVRENAISRDIIPWSNHIKWFDARLRDKNTRIYIMEYHGVPAGQIRYDFDGEAWVVDYSVAADYRGRGFGEKLLSLTLPYFKGEVVRATVCSQNIPSVKVFEKKEFFPIGAQTIHNREFTVYQYQS